MTHMYEDKLNEIFAQIGDHAQMVLATSQLQRVSARTMSVLINHHTFYFQTDKTSHKYLDISANPHVALCIDNIQIEGIVKDLGHPLDHEQFCLPFQMYYRSSYEAYTHLKNERLLMVIPTFIQRWKYVNGQPIIEQLYINEMNYLEQEYNTKNE